MKPDIENKLIKERDDRNTLVPEFIYDFIIDQNTTKQLTTQIEYLKDIEKFLDFLMEQEQFEGKKETIKDFTIEDMEKVTTRDIRNFLSHLVQYKKERKIKGKEGKTVKKVYRNTEIGQARKLATIHTLYDYLIKEDKIKINPSAKVEIKLPKKIGITNLLDSFELRTLLNTINDDKNISTDKAEQFNRLLKLRDYSICLIMSHTGVRVSELVQLDIQDLNIDKNKVTVIRKGKKIQELALPYDILEPLAEYIEHRKTIKDVPADFANALFLSLQKKRINSRTVRYMLNKYRVRANINTKITPHTMRRTFGTKLYNDTRDIQLTADVLGHESNDTTRRSYALIDKDREAQAMHEFTYGSSESNKNTGVDLSKNMDALEKLAKKTGLTIKELLDSIK